MNLNPFYISAYIICHTIMILVSKNTFLRLTNPMGTFAICILDGHLVNQDGHHKIFLFTYYCVKTSYKSPLRAGNPDNNLYHVDVLCPQAC